MKSINKTYNFLFSSVFILIIVSSCILFFVIPDKEKDDKENRMLKQFPIVNIAFLDSFPKEFEVYMNDQFPFRSHIIKVYNRMQLFFFKRSAGDKVVVGKNGWFYMKAKEILAYQAKELFSPEELESIYNELLHRKSVIEKNGGLFYFVIAPTKYSVYPEYVGIRERVSERTNKREQLVSFLKAKGSINVIDLTPSSLEAKKNERLYHKTDNHWNSLGAFIGSNTILSSISKDFPDVVPIPLSNFTIEKKIVDGKNLINMIGLSKYYSEEKIDLINTSEIKLKKGIARKYKIPKWFPYPWEFEMVYVNDKAPKLKMLMIRESFGTYQIPYLGLCFEESVFIFDAWKHGLNQEIVENEQADIVVLQILECFLDNLLPIEDEFDKYKKD